MKSGSERSLDHVPILDGLRGIAVLMVMWFHFFQDTSPLEAGVLFRAIDVVTPFGRTGVDLFFVLSGFLITRILIVTKDEPAYFRNFYARRFLRIFPLYYFFLALATFVVPVVLDERTPTFSENWYWWVHLQNLPLTFGWAWGGPEVYWTLAVEEHFYLLWPLVIFLTPRRRLAHVAAALVVTALVVRLAVIGQGIDVYYFTLTRMDALALGALLAIFEPIIRADRVAFHRRFLISLAATGIPLLTMLAVVGGTGTGPLQAVRYSFQSLTYASVVGVALTIGATAPFRKIVQTWFLAYTGSISFGLYVYHRLAFVLANRFLPPTALLVRFVPAFALAFVMAHFSYRLLELPFLSLKRYFVRPIRV